MHPCFICFLQWRGVSRGGSFVVWACGRPRKSGNGRRRKTASTRVPGESCNVLGFAWVFVGLCSKQNGEPCLVPAGHPKANPLVLENFEKHQIASSCSGRNHMGCWLMKGNCKRFALPASAQPSLREGSGTPKSSVGKVRIPEAGSRQVRQAGLAWLGWATG